MITVGSYSYEAEVTDTNMKIASDGSVSTGERADGMGGRGFGKDDNGKQGGLNRPGVDQKPGI